MSCPAFGCFIESEEVSPQLHKTFHWLNGEGSYAHIRISSFSLTHFVGFQGERGERCVCVWACECVCVQGEGLLCHDSPAWIKCGTLIWVKIMESYMSLSMSAFLNRPKWELTAGRSRRGGQRWRNKSQVTTRASLRLTCSQTEPGAAVNKQQAAKNTNSLISSFVYLLAYLFMGQSRRAQMWISDFTVT